VNNEPKQKSATQQKFNSSNAVWLKKNTILNFDPVNNSSHFFGQAEVFHRIVPCVAHFYCGK